MYILSLHVCLHYRLMFNNVYRVITICKPRLRIYFTRLHFTWKVICTLRNISILLISKTSRRLCIFFLEKNLYLRGANLNIWNLKCTQRFVLERNYSKILFKYDSTLSLQNINELNISISEKYRHLFGRTCLKA